MSLHTPSVSFRNYSFTFFFPVGKEKFEKYFSQHADNLNDDVLDKISFLSDSFQESELGYSFKEGISADRISATLYGLFKSVISNKPTITFVIGQVERCPTTGRPHIQGFLKCEKLTFNTVQKALFPGTHLEVSRSSPQANVNYVTKSKTKMSPHVYVGDPPRGSGHRTDLEAVYTMLEDMVPEDQMLAVLRHDGLRHLQLYQRGLDVMLGQAHGQERRNAAIADRRQEVIARTRAYQEAAEAGETASYLRVHNEPLEPLRQPPGINDDIGFYPF